MMTPASWKPYKLHELGSVGRGKSKHRPRNDKVLYGGKYPFFQTGDVKAAGYKLRSYSQTYNELGLAQSKLWKPGTLCITIAANIADTAILDIEGCFPDSVVGFIPDEKKSDVRFIKYAIDTLKLRMMNISRGTTQDNLSVDKLLTFDIYAPNVEKQGDIAHVLSAYDELIDNNSKRIKKLEAMAQQMYKHYFSLYSGEIIESTIGECIIGLETGKRPKGGVGDLDKGVPSVGAENINGIGIHDYSKEKYITEEFYASMKNGIIKDGDIAIYKDGAYIGRSTYFKNNFPYAKACVNEHVFLLKNDPSKITSGVLYLTIQDSDTLSAIRATNSNSAQPGINQPGLNGVHVKLLPLPILEELENTIDPLFSEIINLAKKNRNLAKLRNLLLPRLMSGEIQV